MEDNNFSNVDMALAAIENCFSYYRPIVNISTGEINFVMSKQKITKVGDNNIRIEAYFDDNFANTTIISADIFIDAIKKASRSDISDLNDFTEIMSNFMVDSFKKYYNTSYTTVRDLIENSNIVILDKQKNPLMALKNNDGFIEYSDILENLQNKNIPLSLYFNYTFTTEDFSDNFYSLIDRNEWENKVTDNNFIINFYNQKYSDKIFSFHSDGKSNQDGISIKKFDIVTATDTIIIYKNNLDKPKNLLFSLSDAFRQKTKKLSLFAN